MIGLGLLDYYIHDVWVHEGKNCLTNEQVSMSAIFVVRDNGRFDLYMER